SVTGLWQGLVHALPIADPGSFHHATLAAVVMLSLLVVNTKAGSLFVVTLVKPRSSVSGTPPARPPSGPPPERIGQAIGMLERLLVVALVLIRAEAAIGLVLAAKTIARFKQLDDREFAEYYLLGTLASVAVAIATALVARAALGVLLG
ncbi:MAG TPA: hypothetical protein VFR93_09100, partial [Candidatus Limnocylindrales bacterium]|nr:hypothetical protein [Candidatus Limnocylindrales bacterium]